MPKEQLKSTICVNLGFLYRQALVRKDEPSAAIIKECFIMAKKMNRRLLEYKYAGDGTSEEDWLKELDFMGKMGIWKILLK